MKCVWSRGVRVHDAVCACLLREPVFVARLHRGQSPRAPPKARVRFLPVLAPTDSRPRVSERKKDPSGPHMAEAKRARRMALVAAAGGVEPLGTGSACADCGAPRTALNTGVCWSDTAKTRLTFHSAACDACRSARACASACARTRRRSSCRWAPTRRRAPSGRGTRARRSPPRRARRGSARCSRRRAAGARRARTTSCSPPGAASSWHRSTGWAAPGTTTARRRCSAWGASASSTTWTLPRAQS